MAGTEKVDEDELVGSPNIEYGPKIVCLVCA